MRKKIIAGNWKMHKNNSEAMQFVKLLKVKLVGYKKTEIVVCPVFTALSSVKSVLEDSQNIKLGAQNVHFEEKGAFTGEVSAEMLLSCGCDFVIIGHSERRQYFCETDQTVNKKVKKALSCGLKPIVCIGELLAEREANQTMNVIERQTKALFEGLSEQEATKLVIAYEPVWAIGTGKVATPEQAQEVHAFIRKLISELYSEKIAEIIRIQYGGSMKGSNAKELLSQKDIDGGLIGGACLEADAFKEIIEIAESLG
ncbi:triose-phosphate isomerase [bacterium]|nr:triose-phosphate isomerase [bacterium]